ncbi:MAG: hypothetical protein GKS06_00600 [Acidobacteria bacterium]|nr:hypothetical protein [Acidobacteriota bacterium]
MAPLNRLLAVCLLPCAAASACGGQAAPVGQDGDAACVAALSAGAEVGIRTIPSDYAATHGEAFCKYTEVTAPNGKAITIFAQVEISNAQLIYARSVLEFFLEDVPGSLHGADKSAIANRMADNGASMLMLKGHDGEHDLSALEGLRGQPLYEDETAAPGSAWYIENVFDGHRDATFEEIFHLVHDFGIGVDYEGAARGAAPEYQAAIRAAQINALDVEGLWAQDDRVSDWIEELREEGSLTQEYIASVIDSYYGLWGPYTERPGGMWGFYVAKTRDAIATADPRGFELMQMFLSPVLTFEVPLPPDFEGTFTMTFDPETPYTHKSRYLRDVTLTGSEHANLVGNELDNRLRGNAGNNVLDGGPGFDTAAMRGPRSDYDVTVSSTADLVLTDRVANRDGSVHLRGVEEVDFGGHTMPTADLIPNSEETQ